MVSDEQMIKFGEEMKIISVEQMTPFEITEAMIKENEKYTKKSFYEKNGISKENLLGNMFVNGTEFNKLLNDYPKLTSEILKKKCIDSLIQLESQLRNALDIYEQLVFGD